MSTYGQFCPVVRAMDLFDERWTLLTTRLRTHDARPDAQDWWVVVNNGDVDLGDVDPGLEVTAGTKASFETLTRVRVGELPRGQAVRAGSLRTIAPEDTRRQVPRWLKRFASASVPRPAAT
jgi:hypothetical protein